MGNVVDRDIITYYFSYSRKNELGREMGFIKK